ncbi:hypothetical protein H0H81_011116 [Sphagnurus paluster]|uniref:Uncharacterized protein n=1 Tax=Sphagnurus paluster TaxID=117069 RepID=A0A9P7GVK9_9AGAR|nr:hypothetical protein H0H81_011116 [Sphagnurus paluster]
MSRSHNTATSSMSALTTTHTHNPRPSPSHRPSGKAWVDPASLPDYGDISTIRGNAPDYVKQLNSNTYFSYGVGDEDCFGHKVGKTVKFVDVNIDRREERQGRMEATTVAEVVDKDSGRIVASGFLNKMQPGLPKL